MECVEVEDLEVVVIVGANNPHYEHLQSAMYTSSLALRLERNVTNMPELMAWADVAIATAGTTSWELLFMGLPNLVLAISDNQLPISESLGRAEVSINLGWFKNLTSPALSKAVTHLLNEENVRTKMQRYSRKLVDGAGGNRVANFLIGVLENFNADHLPRK